MKKGTIGSLWCSEVIHLVYERNIVIFPEFNELKLVFHEAQPSGIQDFNELNEGNMTIFHE